MCNVFTAICYRLVVVKICYSRYVVNIKLIVSVSVSFAVVYNILFDSLHTSSKANYLVGHSTDSLRRFFFIVFGHIHLH